MKILTGIFCHFLGWMAISGITPGQAKELSSHGAAILNGSQRSEILVHGPSHLLPSYVNNGFSQRVRPGDPGSLIIAISNQPLADQTPARDFSSLEDLFPALAQELKDASCPRLVDQVAWILSWIRKTIAYDASHDSNDPLTTILQEQKANCVGLSLLAKTILASLGVESRFATGFVFKPDHPARQTLQGPVLHRWLEIRYPEAGWVFCDPAGKINYVEANYVLMSTWQDAIDEQILTSFNGLTVELLSWRNEMRLHGIHAGLDARLGMRPIQP
jgi:transglutaminase-like putative cysteine protease